MNAAKLRKTISRALDKAGPRIDYNYSKDPERLADLIAYRIEIALEIEADEKDLELDYDDIVSRPDLDSKTRISDSLAPPPPGTSLILTPEMERNIRSAELQRMEQSGPARQASGQVIPIDSTQVTLTAEEVTARVSILMSVLEQTAPTELSVIPIGADQAIILKRQIDTIPDAGMVRLSYRLGVENSSTPSTSSGANSQPSSAAPMAVDTPPSTCFSVTEGINPSPSVLNDRLSKVSKLAEFIYRKNKGAVVSRTVIREGPMSFNPRQAAHDDA